MRLAQLRLVQLLRLAPVRSAPLRLAPRRLGTSSPAERRQFHSATPSGPPLSNLSASSRSMTSTSPQRCPHQPVVIMAEPDEQYRCPASRPHPRPDRAPMP